MKTKLRVIFALLPALAVLVYAGEAQAASGSWFAQGSGTVLNTNPADFPTPTVERWQWVATSGIGTPAMGAPAKGHFSERVPGSDPAISFDADVTCLNVDGNTARIGITVTRSTNTRRPVGTHTWITMTSIGQGLDALHLVGADGSNMVPPSCPPPSGARDPFHGPIGIRAEASAYGWLAQGAGNISFESTVHRQWVGVSDVGGANARGHYAQQDSATGIGFTADVACLQIAGDSARIGLIITESTNPLFPAGLGTYIHMTTTGQGGSASNALLPDGATYPAVDPITFRPLSCGPPVPGGHPFDGTMNLRG